MYSIAYTRSARKSLKSLPADTRRLLVARIEALAVDPLHAPNIKKLQGRPGYRMRVGGWRVIYDIEFGRLVILVLEIGARGSIYS